MSILNQSDKSPQIELLPVELQCRVLKSIPNMKALRALLSASPQLFQVFKTCREVVLSHVAWNHITPAVVPLALKALDQREDRESTTQRTLKEPREIPLETWESLLRFHRIVDSLISNFTSSRLVALENSMHPHKQTSSPRDSPGPNLNLSQLEYGRLARAFYHLELYSYLKGYSKRGMLMACWTFMQSLRNWEVEELLSVRSYMMERLIDYLNQFEEDFMKAYLKDKPCIIWPSQDTEWLNGRSLNWRCNLFVDNNKPDQWMDDCSKKPYQWIESCLSRGLKFLSAVFSADKLPDKFNALDRIDPQYHWISYALANAVTHPEEQVTAKIEGPSENGFYNDIEQPNEAWFWAIGSKIHKKSLCIGCDSNDFQRWGYVIWDHARLERLGIITKKPSDVQATIGTDWLIKRTPKSLEARTSEQEEIWSQEGLESTLTEPRPVFDWEKIWFK
ncbi:hypothetical protein MMC31_007151 [Peltigera leucophlebia]|nr:hypothetical protein [Peltigera leucophlebia]